MLFSDAKQCYLLKNDDVLLYLPVDVLEPLSVYVQRRPHLTSLSFQDAQSCSWCWGHMDPGMLVKWGALILQITHVESWLCRNVDKGHQKVEEWVSWSDQRGFLLLQFAVSWYVWTKHLYPGPGMEPACEKCSNFPFLCFIHKLLSSSGLKQVFRHTHSWTRHPLNEALTCEEKGDNGRFRSRDLSAWSITAEIQSHLRAFGKHMESMWSMLSLFIQIPLSDCCLQWFVLWWWSKTIFLLTLDFTYKH